MKNLANVEGVKRLNSVEQKNIIGGETRCNQGFCSNQQEHTECDFGGEIGCCRSGCCRPWTYNGRFCEGPSK